MCVRGRCHRNELYRWIGKRLGKTIGCQRDTQRRGAGDGAGTISADDGAHLEASLAQRTDMGKKAEAGADHGGTYGMSHQRSPPCRT
ncbi:hypothetical protein D3C71_2010800 [compost metagenome]